MADPVSASIIIGATAGSMYMQSEAADAQEAAYRTKANQERVAAMNRTVQRQHKLKEVLSTQQSLMGARGVQASSDSFKAIQAGAFEQFDEDENADALNQSYNDKYINDMIGVNRANANAQMFGTLMSGATGMYNINKTPGI